MMFWSRQPAWLKLSTLAYVLLWVLTAVVRAIDLVPAWAMLAVLLLSLPLGIVWLARLRRQEPANQVLWSIVGSVLLVAWGRLIVEAASLLSLPDLAGGLDSALHFAVFTVGLLWVVWGLEKA